MYKIIALDSTLNEKVIYSDPDPDKCIRLLNTFAKRFGYKFKKDQSLFGGYFVAPKTGICYSVK